jgi:hypothetical protein
MEFDLAEVEKLGMLGATEVEMAAWFNCGLRTIESAKSGNVTMLIWLGKQLLDQADKREVKEEATFTQKSERPLALSPEDEEFLRRKTALSGKGTTCPV